MTLPNDPITPIAVPPSTNTDLPANEYPSFTRVTTSDLVGPSSTNRQHVSAERRSMTARDRINKLIELANAIDEVMLRRDGSTQKSGGAGLTGDIPANDHTLTGLRAAAAGGEAVRFDEFSALAAIVADLVARPSMPSGMIGAFPGTVAPNGWILADGTLYTTTSIVDATGVSAAYPSGLTWTMLNGLRAYCGNLWGGDGLTSFRVPDYRGRVILGAGTGRIPTTLTARTPGTYGGEETHALTADELAAHNHNMFANSNGPNGSTTLTATSTTAAMGGFGTSDHSAYSLKAASVAATLGVTADKGTGAGHNTMPPFGVALVCLKL